MMDLEKVRNFSGIIGNSPAIEQVLEMIIQVAPVDISVLIAGESGTGKEMVARSIHKLSRRSHKEIVIVNCGAIPSGIIESELFGHKRGAFTGAGEDRKGYFEEANEGTIFLDEIGEMPVETQVKLLRVLEIGEFMRVGDAKTRRSDVRVIAATNKNLTEEVSKGNFRRDLFYRLRTVTIEIPPLRRHLEDLDVLVERFALQFSRSSNIPYRGFTSDAIKVMKQYDWPGNVRELKNLVESIILLEKGQRISSDIILKHLSSAIKPSRELPIVVNKSSEQVERELILQQLILLRNELRELRSAFLEANMDRTNLVSEGSFRRLLPTDKEVSNISLNSVSESDDLHQVVKSGAIGDVSMHDVEMEIITRTLQKFKNNRRRTAKALRISERTLYRKINEYGLDKKKKSKK